MSSVLATRKMAGAGNFFVGLQDASGLFTIDTTAVSPSATYSSDVAVGKLYQDLGERVVIGDVIYARVRLLGAADNEDGSDAEYVVVRCTDNSEDVYVAHVGAGTRN